MPLTPNFPLAVHAFPISWTALLREVYLCMLMGGSLRRSHGFYLQLWELVKWENVSTPFSKSWALMGLQFLNKKSLWRALDRACLLCFKDLKIQSTELLHVRWPSRAKLTGTYSRRSFTFPEELAHFFVVMRKTCLNSYPMHSIVPGTGQLERAWITVVTLPWKLPGDPFRLDTARRNGQKIAEQELNPLTGDQHLLLSSYNVC